jgi:hypothetical protein
MTQGPNLLRPAQEAQPPARGRRGENKQLGPEGRSPSAKRGGEAATKDRMVAALPRSTTNRPAPVQVAEGGSHVIAPGRCTRREGLRIDKPGHSLIGQLGPMVVRADRSKVAQTWCARSAALPADCPQELLTGKTGGRKVGLLARGADGSPTSTAMSVPPIGLSFPL